MADVQAAEVPDQALGADEEPHLNEVEQIASEMGWKPKDSYEGPEHLWRPASDFIRKMPGSRDLKKEIKGLRDQMDRMTNAQARTMDRSLREQRSEIEARFSDAVDNKDRNGAAKAVADLRQLEQESAPVSAKNVEAEFAERNPWYDKHDEATAFAISISQRLARQGKSVDEQLEAAEVGVRKAFPDLFETRQAAKPPAGVATPSRGSGAARSKGYADLPTDAKRAADQFAETAKTRFGKDLDATRKQYAADYFANGEAA